MFFALSNKQKNHLSIISFSSLEQYFKEVIEIIVLSLSKNYLKMELLKEVENIHWNVFQIRKSMFLETHTMVS